MRCSPFEIVIPIIQIAHDMVRRWWIAATSLFMLSNLQEKLLVLFSFFISIYIFLFGSFCIIAIFN